MGSLVIASCLAYTFLLSVLIADSKGLTFKPVLCVQPDGSHSKERFSTFFLNEHLLTYTTLFAHCIKGVLNYFLLLFEDDCSGFSGLPVTCLSGQ